MSDIWQNCYDDQWRGLIVPEAFSHPAKVARGLARRIYDHALAEKWLQPGDTVLDPFAGIGGFALGAVEHELNWVGVELEPRFVALAEQNLEIWRRMFRQPRLLSRMVQGDSRQLSELFQGADCVVGSPPYAGNDLGGDGQRKMSGDYSAEKNKATKEGKGLHGNYGSSPGQLGSMPAGKFDAVVGSPPFMEAQSGGGISAAMRGEGNYKMTVRPLRNCYQPSEQGTTDGNLAAANPDTFWSSAREILVQCYAVLKPGGHAIWVTKDFVRNGKRVPFSDQWQDLCESVGFKMICRHQAALVKVHGKQKTIFGDEEEIKTERKSFFRRLAEKNGSPRIDHEDVICFEKHSEGEE